MPDSAAGGFATGFNSAFGGTLNTIFQMQNSEMQHQRLELEKQAAQNQDNLSTLQMLKVFREDPGTRPVVQDLFKKKGIPDEQAKSWLDTYLKMDQDKVDSLNQVYAAMGVKDPGWSPWEFIKMPLSQQFTTLQAMHKQQGEQAGSAIMAGQNPAQLPAPGAAGTPGVQPTQGGIGSAPTGSAPITPVQSEPLGPPGSTPAGPRLPAAASTALGAPPATQLPGMPAGSQHPDAAHAVVDAPALKNADTARRLNETADKLDALGHTDTANDYRKRAKDLEGVANISIPWNDPRAPKGLLPGAIIQHNLVNGTNSLLQAGRETETIVDPNSPLGQKLYKDQLPGTIVSKNDQSGKVTFTSNGHETFKQLTAEQLKLSGAGPGMAGEVGSSGKTTFSEINKGEERPMTPEERGQFNLGPNMSGTINTVTKKPTIQQGRDIQVRPMTDAESSAAGVGPGKVGYYDENGKPQVVDASAGVERPMTVDERKTYNVGSNMSATINTITAKPTITQGMQDQYRQVPDSERAQLEALGVKLPPASQPLQFNITHQKFETLGGENKKFIQLTPAQAKALSVPTGPGLGAQQDVGTGHVELMTATTPEARGNQLASERDAKTLATLAARGEAATDVMKTNQIITSASKQFSTGPTASTRLFAGQVASDLGFPQYEKLFGTAQGELLESQFGQKVIGAAKLLPGAISDKDTALATKAVGGMFRTKEGNKLMVDLSNWSANIQNDEHLSAEQWQNKFAPQGGGLSTPDPATGKNWYQINSEKQRNIQLPNDLRQRLEGVVADMPDKSLKIKEWQTPISQMSLGQITVMMSRYKDRFNVQQLQLMLKRNDELTGGQSGGPR